MLVEETDPVEVTFVIAIVTSIILGGSLTAISSTSGIGGFWIIVNLQQVLMTMLLVDTVIHPDIRFFISRTSILSFNFAAIGMKDLLLGDSSEKRDSVYREQNSEGLSDIGLQSVSAAEESVDWVLICVFVLFSYFALTLL